MTYEDNKKKRSTLPVVGCVCGFATDLCFLGGVKYQPLMRMGSKVLWFFKQINNSKTKTMETTKEEMTLILRKLQDLQQWIYNSSHEILLDINFNVLENSIAIYGHVGFFGDFRMNKSVHIYSQSSYEENRTQLNYFIEYVKKLSKYGNRKIETN